MKLKPSRALFWIVVAVLVVAAGGILFWLPHLNQYQREGTIVLPGLSKPVTIMRDEKGMAYIRAETLYDGLMLKHLTIPIVIFCYGAATLATLAAAWLLWSLP